jgi:hypothetical protein
LVGNCPQPSLVRHMFATDLGYRNKNGWFPIHREAYNAVMHPFLGLFKMLFLVFNLVPYLAFLIQ